MAFTTGTKNVHNLSNITLRTRNLEVLRSGSKDPMHPSEQSEQNKRSDNIWVCSPFDDKRSKR